MGEGVQANWLGLESVAVAQLAVSDTGDTPKPAGVLRTADATAVAITAPEEGTGAHFNAVQAAAEALWDEDSGQRE